MLVVLSLGSRKPMAAESSSPDLCRKAHSGIRANQNRNQRTPALVCPKRDFARRWLGKSSENPTLWMDQRARSAETSKCTQTQPASFPLDDISYTSKSVLVNLAGSYSGACRSSRRLLPS